MSAPAGTRDEVFEGYRRHVNATLARLGELMAAPVVDRAEGDYVWTETGNRLLDCGGFGLFLLGHGYRPVVDAVAAQVRTMALTGPMVVHRALALAAGTLAGACPPGLDYVYLTNSGTEATETALKLARMNGRNHVVATIGGFHGKTLGALGVTGRDAFRAPFEPLPGPVDFVSFGDAAALAARLTPRTCVIVEPIQGEGGIRLPPDGYLRAVADACADAGALLVADEIQVGLGRVGTRWAVEREGVVPDMLLSGKALGGGVIPVGAVVASPEVFEPLNRDPVLHTSTNGGNPLAAVAVHHAVTAVVTEDVPGRATRLAGPLRALLTERLRPCSRLIREIRGRGVLFGVEFVHASLAGEFVLDLLDQGVVVAPAANSLATVRVTPSAFFGATELDRLGQALDGAAWALAGRHKKEG